MKNLVSKNPVQRFKQGRKILFAKPGDKMLYNDNEEVVKEILNGQTIYRRKNGTYVYPNSKLLSPIKTSTSIDYSFIKGEKPRQRTSGEQKKQKSEVQRQKNIQDNIQKKKIITPTKKTVVNNRILPKYSGVDLQGKTVGEWQNILKDYYAPGTKKKYMKDGIWGDATNVAYETYLQKQKEKEVLEHPTLENVAKIGSIIPAYTPPTEVPSIQKIEQPSYNRAGVRNFLRQKKLNPYSFSGVQRRALRMVLNGTADDNDKLLVKGMGIFEKGGQLPSRNVIKRFKNKI